MKCPILRIGSLNQLVTSYFCYYLQLPFTCDNSIQLRILALTFVWLPPICKNPLKIFLKNLLQMYRTVLKWKWQQLGQNPKVNTTYHLHHYHHFHLPLEMAVPLNSWIWHYQSANHGRQQNYLSFVLFCTLECSYSTRMNTRIFNIKHIKWQTRLESNVALAICWNN